MANFARQLAAQRTNLPKATQNITADETQVQANITTLANTEIALTQQLENQRQMLTDSQEL